MFPVKCTLAGECCFLFFFFAHAVSSFPCFFSLFIWSSGSDSLISCLMLNWGSRASQDRGNNVLWKTLKLRSTKGLKQRWHWKNVWQIRLYLFSQHSAKILIHYFLHVQIPKCDRYFVVINSQIIICMCNWWFVLNIIVGLLNWKLENWHIHIEFHLGDH